MRRALTALFLIASLSGCATHWVVDSEVKTFSSPGTIAAGATYRFERLPSPQVDPARQAQLEAMAGAALAKVGLRSDEARPAYSALIGARVTTELPPWADPWLYGPGVPGYGGLGRAWYGGGWYGPPLALPASNPWYEREVSVVLRDLASGQVVYETRARNDGPYNISADILPVLFDAAMQGFPNPPADARRVDIELPPRR